MPLALLRTHHPRAPYTDASRHLRSATVSPVSRTANTPLVTRPPLSQDFAQAFPSLALIYCAVTDLGAPNYRGARFPVPYELNISAWKERSHLFKDPSLIQMLESKCWESPLRHTAPIRCHHLHQEGARAHSHHRPTSVPPFPVAPIQPYDDQAQEGLIRLHRVIVDLSMPPEASVNSGIPKNSLDGAPFKLWLPNPATLANKILEYGRGCLLYKVDLSTVYRQLRTDPLDWPFLMLEWDQQFSWISPSLSDSVTELLLVKGPQKLFPPSPERRQELIPPPTLMTPSGLPYHRQLGRITTIFWTSWLSWVWRRPSRNAKVPPPSSPGSEWSSTQSNSPWP